MKSIKKGLSLALLMVGGLGLVHMAEAKRTLGGKLKRGAATVGKKTIQAGKAIVTSPEFKKAVHGVAQTGITAGVAYGMGLEPDVISGLAQKQLMGVATQAQQDMQNAAIAQIQTRTGVDVATAQQQLTEMVDAQKQFIESQQKMGVTATGAPSTK